MPADQVPSSDKPALDQTPAPQPADDPAATVAEVPVPDNASSGMAANSDNTSAASSQPVETHQTVPVADTIAPTSDSQQSEVASAQQSPSSSSAPIDGSSAQPSVNVQPLNRVEEDPDEDSEAQAVLLEQIERDYEDIMGLNDVDPQSFKIKQDYDKLYTIFKQSRQREHDVSFKLRRLKEEMAAQQLQSQMATKLNQADRNTIGTLKKDIKKAKEAVEEAKERDERAKETIQQLKVEVSVLQNAIDQAATSGNNNEQLIPELQKQKEELLKERDSQLAQIVQLREEINELSTKIKNLETDRSKQDHVVSKLRETLSDKKNEVEKETSIRERLEREIKDLKSNLDQKSTDIKQKNEALAKNKEEISKLEVQIKEQKILIERVNKEQEQLQYTASKLQTDYNEQLLATTHLAADNQEKAAELKTKDEEIQRIQSDIKRVTREKDILNHKFKVLEEQKTSAEIEKDQLKLVKNGLERDIDDMKKDIDHQRRHVEDLAREKDAINRNLQKADSATKKQAMLVKLQEQSKQTLEQDIVLYKEEAAKQRKIIYSLEKERDKFINDAAEIQQTLGTTITELAEKDTNIVDFKKKIVDVEQKLKQQQNLFEAMKADRNNYSKNLIESQDEINEMKGKIRVLGHQIEQLKKEIHGKDTIIEKCQHDQHQAEKERDRLKVDLQKLKKNAETADEYYHHQQVEEQNLRTLVSNAEAELTRQKHEYESVIQERDIVNNQMIKRNEEIALLYEKIKIQQSVLTKGEKQYTERTEDIKSLKVEIENLRAEKTALQKEVVEIEQYKADVVKLEKEITREKSRVKVLEEQLQNPINVHRWRQLEGTNPETFELIQKVQTLQKRLIAKTEEVIEKELAIQQKEKLYDELKSVLARQQGPEIYEQLNAYQLSVRDKTQQLKAMKSELQMYHNQVNQYKFEIERLNREALSLKRLFYEQKQKQRTQAQSATSIIEKKTKLNGNNIDDAIKELEFHSLKHNDKADSTTEQDSSAKADANPAEVQS